MSRQTNSTTCRNGPAVIQRQKAIEQSPYQRNLELGLEPPQLTTDSVRYWSDFNRVYYHPKSIVQLNEYELSSTLMPFENWNVGEELFTSLDKDHDLLDRDLRPFAEEADQLQGIQIMAGIDDAWGGFAAKYMDRLRDEYGKTTVWFWGLEDGIKGVPRHRRFLKLSNTARSISEISSQASLFIPMTLPSSKLPEYVSIDPRSEWHVSGLLSTALESMSLASRLKPLNGRRETLHQLASALNINGGQRIAKLRMSIVENSTANGRSIKADRVGEKSDMRMQGVHGGLEEAVSDDLSTFDMDFFPPEVVEQSHGRHRIRKTHVFGQVENYRDSESKDDEVDQPTSLDYEGYDRARRRAAGLPLIFKTQIPLSFPLLDSFPHIFAQSSGAPASVPVKSSLSTDTTVALKIKNLQSIVSKVVGIDEREALANSLGEIAEAYEEGWDSGSDEDDD